MLFFRSKGGEKSSEAESPYDVIVLSVIPAFHAYGMVVIMTVMLLAGAQVITLPRFHPEQYLSAIEKYKVNCKAHIPLGVLFVLRWQSSPMQMKYTCNANDSTYILLELLIKIRYIWGSVL